MPTLSVRLFDYETLKTHLKSEDRIVVLSCDACAKQSGGLGGEAGLNGLADKLAADGFEVSHRELLPVACSPDQLSDRLQDEAARKLFEEADVVIPLACQAGVARSREVLPAAKILVVTRTLGKGPFSPEGGARLTEPLEGVDIEIDDPDGVPIAEAAERLGLHAGRF